MLTAMFLWANHATGTGLVKADILVSSAALLCLYSTRTGGDVLPHQQKTATYQLPKHHLQERRITSVPDQEAEVHQDQGAGRSSHLIQGEEVDKEGLRGGKVGLSHPNP